MCVYECVVFDMWMLLCIPFIMRVYNEAVLDLSDKGDVESVKKRLENVEVNL